MLSLTKTRLKWPHISLYKEKHAEALKVASRPVLVRHFHVLFTGMEERITAYSVRAGRRPPETGL